MFKNKTALVFGIVLLGIIIFVGYKYFGGSYTQESTTPATTQVAPNTIDIQSNAFSPETLNVKVGQKVTWTNSDSYAHTITSDDGTFDSGNMGAGKTYSYTFSKAGTYNYHCTIHTFMTGKVVVTN